MSISALPFPISSVFFPSRHPLGSRRMLIIFSLSCSPGTSTSRSLSSRTSSPLSSNSQFELELLLLPFPSSKLSLNSTPPSLLLLPSTASSSGLLFSERRSPMPPPCSSLRASLPESASSLSPRIISSRTVRILLPSFLVVCSSARPAPTSLALEPELQS